MNLTQKSKVTIAIIAITALIVCLFGFIGLKDAQALDENVTFLSNFVTNLKSDEGILACVCVVALAVVSVIAPRFLKK